MATAVRPGVASAGGAARLLRRAVYGCKRLSTCRPRCAVSTDGPWVSSRPQRAPQTTADAPSHDNESKKSSRNGSDASRALMRRIRACRRLAELEAVVDEQRQQLDHAHVSALAFSAAQLATSRRRNAPDADVGRARQLVALCFDWSRAAAAAAVAPSGTSASDPAVAAAAALEVAKCAPYMLWAAAKVQYGLPAEEIRRLVIAHARQMAESAPATPLPEHHHHQQQQQHDASSEQLMQLPMLAWAAAKLGCRGRTAWQQLAPLVEAAAPRLSPQSLSNCLWAFATAGYHHHGAMQALLAAAGGHVAGFNAADVASTMWAVARLTQVRRNAVRLMDQLADAAGRHVAGFDAQQLVNVAWAAATFGLPCPDLLIAVAHRAAPLVSSRALRPLEVASLVWACAKQGVAPQELLDAAADSWMTVHVEHAEGTTTTTSKGAYGGGGGDDDDDDVLLHRLSDPTSPSAAAATLVSAEGGSRRAGGGAAGSSGRGAAAGGGSTAHALALMAWSFALLQSEQPSLAPRYAGLMARLADQAAATVDVLTDRGVAMLAWALARTGHLSPQLWEALAARALQPELLMDYSPASLTMLLTACCEAPAMGAAYASASTGTSGRPLATGGSSSSDRNSTPEGSAFSAASGGHEQPQQQTALASQRLVAYLADVAHTMVDTLSAQQLSDVAAALARLRSSQPPLFDAIAQRALDTELGGFVPQSLARLAGAFASAGHVDEQLFSAIADAAMARMAQFHVSSLARLTKAFASLGLHDQELLQAVLKQVRALQQAAPEAAAAAATGGGGGGGARRRRPKPTPGGREGSSTFGAPQQALEPRDAAALLWALAAAQHEDGQFIDSCIAHLLRSPGSYSANELGAVAFAVATFKRNSPQLLQLCSRRIRGAGGERWPFGAVASVLWACGRLRHYDPLLLEFVSSADGPVVRTLSEPGVAATESGGGGGGGGAGEQPLLPADLARMTVALATFLQPCSGGAAGGAGGGDLMEAVACAALSQLEDLLPDELASLAWALAAQQLARCSGGGSREAAAAAWPPQQLQLLRAISTALLPWGPSYFEKRELAMLHEAILCSAAATTATSGDSGGCPLQLPDGLGRAASQAWAQAARQGVQGRTAKELRSALEVAANQDTVSAARLELNAAGSQPLVARIGGAAVAVACTYDDHKVAFHIVQAEHVAVNFDAGQPETPLASSRLLRILLQRQGWRVAPVSAAQWRLLRDDVERVAHLLQAAKDAIRRQD